MLEVKPTLSPVLHHSGFFFCSAGRGTPSGDEDGIDEERVVRDGRKGIRIGCMNFSAGFYRLVLPLNEQK